MKRITKDELAESAAEYGIARRARGRAKRRKCDIGGPDEASCLVRNRRFEEQIAAAEEGAADWPEGAQVKLCPRCAALVAASEAARAAKRRFNGRMKSYLARLDRLAAALKLPVELVPMP